MACTLFAWEIKLTGPREKEGCATPIATNIDSRASSVLVSAALGNPASSARGWTARRINRQWCQSQHRWHRNCWTTGSMRILVVRREALCMPVTTMGPHTLWHLENCRIYSCLLHDTQSKDPTANGNWYLGRSCSCTPV